MANKQQFIDAIQKSYTSVEPHIYLGAGLFEGEIVAEAKVNLPLRMMNRHGLIAGATGSGKTRTLQVIAEQLSEAGVPVFLSDIKGDVSGLGKAGISNPKLEERAKALGLEFKPTEFPVELYSLTGKLGAQMRATVSEFGPILLSKILGLNDTQQGVLNILFKYCDDKGMPLVDLADLKKVLNFLSDGPGAAEIKESYGKISTSSSGTILRKIVALEQQGVAPLFGEKSFDVDDLFEKVDGKGVISILNISDMQTNQVVFSTFMVSLLAELYHTMPEAGDLDKPKLVFFLDEAHLLFNDAPKAFTDQIEQVIRLIRSKGIGVFFCTQQPTDVPDTVLSQLGNRFQHVLRAFTPNDADNLAKVVKTYPKSGFYDINKSLTSLGIGQALITVLNEKGIPTEVAATHLTPPRAIMGPMPESDYKSVLDHSDVFRKYKDAVDPKSAIEMLEERLKQADTEKGETTVTPEPKPRAREEKSMIEKVINAPIVKSIGSQLIRSTFSMLFGGRKTTTRKKNGFF
jgi:DNA helicase HerA-like ATPase